MKNAQKIKPLGLIAMAGLILCLLFAAMACERQISPDSSDEAPSPAGPAFAGEPVIIGVMAPMEGEAGHYGRSLVHVAQILAQKANRQGGLCGRRVEIVAQDDSCLAEKALDAAELLVEAGIHAVLGPVCSTAALAALDIFREAGIVVISPSATETQLTRSGLYPLFFRTIVPDDTQARLMADFAAGFLGAQRIAIVANFNIYDTTQAEFAAEVFEGIAHARVVHGEFFAPEKVKWKELAGRVGAVNAQALIFFGHPADSLKMLAAMREQGLETAFVADQRIAGPAFLGEVGDYSSGVFACLIPDISNSRSAKEILMEYRNIYFTEPSPFYLNAHAAVQALFEALASSGCKKGFPLAQTLRAGKTETPLGNIGFDDMGDIAGYGFEMRQLQDGNFVEPGF